MNHIDYLNREFAELSTANRIQQLYEHFDPQEVLVTSSFGITAAILLHHISQYAPEQRVHFVNTQYHFPETLEYGRQLTELLGIQRVDINPELKGHQYTKEHQTWKTAPDLCCQINKVVPLEVVKSKHKVWISGLMAYQSPLRQRLEVFEERQGIVKFHPLIDWQADEVEQYFELHGLPRHPLQGEGFGSIGCVQCTAKGQGRSGRWKGAAKVECGLHTAV